MMFAEVLLPLPLQRTFTYTVPDTDITPVPGHRVVVPFGRSKFYTGIIVGISPRPPRGNFAVKDIEAVLDDSPIVRYPQLKFWEWMAEYYLCSTGEVMRAALPAGLKVESETAVDLCDDTGTLPEGLTEREAIVWQTLDHADKSVNLSALRKSTGFSNITTIVSAMIDKGLVRVHERLVERYTAKTETMVEPAFARGDSEALRKAFDVVKSSPRQQTALMALIEMSGFMRPATQPLTEVTRAALMERSEVSAAIVEALRVRGLVKVTKRRISRFSLPDLKKSPLPQLSEAQCIAKDAILQTWKQKDVVLLRGVTSSGKTEIYMHLIAEALRQKRQALFLVPEIALTTQLTARLQHVFGNDVIIYHSKFSDNRRVEIWRRMLATNQPCVVIGARSSVFLPFAQLGLVVVDEEHEPSYKQQDPAPRYNARDAAMMLASMHGAKVLLGSATPTIDTYWKALSGKFGLVELTERYGGVELPAIEVIDMGRERQRGAVAGTFSDRLRGLVSETVEAGRQAILFLNRRGFAPIARCRQCAYVPKCEHCDVSLTYHKGLNKMVCHYCGAIYNYSHLCPDCHEPALEIVGYGTERIEEEIASMIPEKDVLRMDLDTTRNKDAYQKIIDRFSAGKASVLVGTQMVTKGLDFDKVDVVGVVNSDTMIHLPDFRATERAFNMISQVSGRAGRRAGHRGLVAIQTYTPGHPVFKYITEHDYPGFYQHEVEERKAFNYPPFTRLIHIYIRHADRQTVTLLAQEWGRRLRELFGTRVSGPEEPPVSRIQNMFIQRLMLKVETSASMAIVKKYLRELYEQIGASGQMNGAHVHFDVDPF